MGELIVERAAFAQEATAIRAIRLAVFVKEQGVPLDKEMDGLDLEAMHALAHLDGQPVGTGRLLADGHIGRVAVLREFRGLGIGRAIMSRLLQWAGEQGMDSVALSAQLPVVGFYESLGFTKRGEPYVEVGIEHVDMSRPLRTRGAGEV